MEQVSIDMIDTVAVVTLDNPPVNALGYPILVQIRSAFEELLKVDDLRVVVFTTAGEKSFAAGSDIKYTQNLNHEYGIENGLRRKRILNSLRISLVL
ncbi:MAG: enoyl-CoA hydratase [Pelotomaculum sp. PtaB.Bin104]|nr:MAG: enoyl-CoA hydratase [Pelotomaculum sp. PtaB.Bin104]